MVILGIDPGINITGYGVLECAEKVQPRLLEAGVIRTRASERREKRILSIYEGLCEVVDEFQPAVVAVEELYSHYKHPRTAIVMGHARGMIYLVAAQHEILLVTYAATRIKNAVTGYGHASKKQVQEMIRQSLGLGEGRCPADATDALAAALCHAQCLSHEILPGAVL